MTRLMVVLTLAAALPALAQSSIVPIEQEPRHVEKFRNAHVRFFDVELPPGYESKWHSHVHDGVFVNIAPSETRAQDLGSEPAVRPPRLIGETYFIGYASKPKVHKVDNLGSTPYRVTDTEIHAPCGGYTAAKDGEGQTLIVENERVRVTRLMIGPGESIALHATCGMLVAVTDARLALRPGGPEEQIAMRPADFKWRDSRNPVVLVNVGQTVFHGVDIVVK